MLSRSLIELKECKLIGLSLETKTSNKNGKSSIDCGNLWQKFESGGYAQKIPGRTTSEIFAVYYGYEGDYTKPFSYFIGCKVEDDTTVPEGMQAVVIPDGNYKIVKTKGMIPDCISKAWGVIWSTFIPRAYLADFEVYGEKSKDWRNAEIDIFLSVK
jgi:predicted transcriptional regulator YdeE